jgi:predicted NBD/HSP70 family sugar kinase
VDLPEAGRDRHAQIRRLIDEMESVRIIAEGQFSALGMLLTDASLASDKLALEAAQDGLQWLYSRQEALTDPDDDQVEQRGRLLGLIDVTHWALRRLPSALQLGPDPASHAGQFLKAVAERPGLSNQELAMRLGIDETEASRVGRRLLAAGVVWRRKEWRRNAWDITPRGRTCLVDAGLADADTRQPDLDFAVGVTMLPHRLVGAVVDASARQLASAPLDLDPTVGPAGQVGQLRDLVWGLIAGVVGADEYPPDRIGLGVQVAGHVAASSGKVALAPGYGPPGAWDDFPLHEQLQKATALPAVIENEANVLAEFEYVYGQSQEPQSLVAIVLGAGVGCGMIADGRLIHGVGGQAGQIGHLVVQPGGRTCRCGSKGCLDSMASTAAIPEVFDELAGRGPSEASDLDTVIAHLEKGDEHAAAALDQAGDALGIAIATLLHLINPEKLVLFGPAELVSESRSPAAERFMSRVRESSKEHTFSTAAGDCTLVPKVYDDETGARAAAAVALLRAKDQVP